MWKIIKEDLLGLVIFIPLIIYIGIIAPPDLIEDGLPVKYVLYIIGGFLLLITGIWTCDKIYTKRINDRKTSLIQNGIKGEAEILDMKRTGSRDKHSPVNFQFQVTLPDRFPYQIEHKDVVNPFRVNSSYIGAKRPIYVDPNNPKNVLLIY